MSASPSHTHYIRPWNLRNLASLPISLLGDVTLFFGLSGTGKTTLSTDPLRSLIGDDEHGWGPNGVFNIEGGCYAKTLNLSHASEPEIFSAIRFGSVLENVITAPDTRRVDYSREDITPNTRACYPLEYVAGGQLPAVGPHPKHLIMLCCDAFGVLPPVAKLTSSQAMYHFVSGYTAKVAGTEMGVVTPRATFSPCFGGAFLTRHPMVYARMLAERLHRHNTCAWLVNTGWNGGPCGAEGAMRISLKDTRRIIHAIHSRELEDGEFWTSKVFGLHVPMMVDGVE